MQHKKLRRTLTAAMLTLVATAAFSQENAMSAKIPFAFRAFGSDLPSGRYTIRPARGSSGSSGVVQLRNLDSGKTVLIPSKIPLSEAQDARPRLIFRCEDEQGCSLARLWSGTGTGMEFPTPALTASERERLETIYLDRFRK
jgi:hypothetical protein